MRNSRGGPLRLLGTLRGEGKLLVAAAQIPVQYQVDLFTRGAILIATGEVEGRLSPLRGKPGAVRLRLEDGCIIEIKLTEVNADLAAFEAEEAGAKYCHDLGAGRTSPKGIAEATANPVAPGGS